LYPSTLETEAGGSGVGNQPRLHNKTMEIKERMKERKEGGREEKIALSSHEKIWKKFKLILLSERSQHEKATYYIIPTI
jgi:hypothetical protein